MNFLELSRRRHSVRSYLNRSVEEEKLAYVLECARLSQSAANLQPWILYVVKEGEAKDAISKAYPAAWMAQAPIFIVVCAQIDKAWTRSFDKKVFADIDGSIITENICLAAADCGLGSCWIGHFDPALVKQTLSLPDGIDPVAIVTLGYPADEDIPAKKRKHLHEIVKFLP